MSITTSESAYEQAKKYGEDLAKLFALEKAKRVSLEISNQKLQAIFSNTPDGLAVLDEDLTIHEANPAFWTLIEQLPITPGPSLEFVLPYHEVINQLKKSPPPERTVYHIEIDLKITETVSRSLLIKAIPLAYGKENGWVLAIHDLTEQKRLESLKSEFINIAAHELRTPLAAILGFSQVLKETLQETDDPLSLHLVDTILNSSNRLKGIVDELIEFSDIRYQNDSPSNITTFNLIPIIQDIISQIGPALEQRKLSVETNFKQPRITITGNHNIIKEVLKHLTENAIIFNRPGGKIIFHVHEDEDRTVIQVEDTGIGIPQKELGKIFDKFYQVEEHLTRSIGGLGLGLAIAQKGVTLHGGEISVTSQLNEGSCFTISLPKNLPQFSSEADEGLKDAYQQTIAYSKDLAKSVHAERAMAIKLKKLENTRQELLIALQNNRPLAELQQLVKQMAPEP